MKTIGHLKVNGRPYQPRFSRAEERLKKFLSDMPDDELLNHWPLAKAGGFGSSTIFSARDELIKSGLCLVVDQGRKVYYGNPKAIAALKALPGLSTL
jgi:hypothetical protein